MPARQIWITGAPGSGKTTLARQLGATLGLPHVELDGLYHGPGWTPAEPEAFRAAVAERICGSSWVVDGNYRSALGDLISDTADLRIALDLPIWVTMPRVIRRTVVRGLRNVELWNGNRERLSSLLRINERENLALWAWNRRGAYHRRSVQADLRSRTGGPACVRLTSPAQVKRFVGYLAAQAAG